MNSRASSRLLLVATLLIAVAESSRAQSAPQAFALFSPAMISALRAQRESPLARQFIKEADAHIAQAPSPMPRLHTEGTLPHQGIRDQSIEAERDFDYMQSFAFAYRFTGEKKYLDAESRYLAAWCSTYKISLNPIDETRFDPVIISLDLTRADLPPTVNAQAVAFFREMSERYLDWEDHNATKDNANWNSHRIKLLTLGTYISGDASLIHRAAVAFRAQVKQNIRDDGSVQDFYKRDALHYVTYDLEPLVTAAIAAKAHGEDWFHTAATGKPSVEIAVSWLIPYAKGEKTHEEFVHSTVAFDAARDKAGEKGYSGAWDRAASVNLLGLVTWLDPAYASTLQQVAAKTRNPSPWIQLGIATTAK